MRTDIPPRLLLRRRRWARLGLAALVEFALIGALGAGCAEDPPGAPANVPVVDAGTACERGTLGCACNGGSGCRDNLLCSAGRCIATEGTREPDVEPPARPPPYLPPAPLRDAGASDAATAEPAPGPADASADAAPDAAP